MAGLPSQDTDETASATESQLTKMDEERIHAEDQHASDTNPVDSIEEKLRGLLEAEETDFSAWTSLIAEVEKNAQNDMQKICMVYNSFLSEFPLCYGYWKKYACHKARLCTPKEVEEVYERAVEAAAYSVDLWVSYCSFGELSYDNPDDIRRLYERGFSFVGKDYLCYLLWDKYIQFEYSQKQWSQLAHIYINTLRFPTKKLHSYYKRFKDLVAIWVGEKRCQDNCGIQSDTVPSCETTYMKACGYAGISNTIRDMFDRPDGSCSPNSVKKYASVGELLYDKSSQLDRKISFFETRIRRPYFHVKPLDDCQLENWRQYLDFVEMQGDFDWAVKLYERCLIPCANYSEFWIRYVEFVESKGGREIANYAINRALPLFLKKVPAFHVFSAMFMELVGDVAGARSSFPGCSGNLTPIFIENVNREANRERRMGDFGSACRIYENAIEMAKEKQNDEILSALYTNFARFTFAVSGSIDDAKEVFIKGIQQRPCKLIIEGLILFVTTHGGKGQIASIDSIVADSISPGSAIYPALSSHDREDISKLFLEFVDLYGTIHEFRTAWDRHRKHFPHILRPPHSTTSTSATVKSSSLGKSVDDRNGIFVASSHDASGNNHDDDVDIPIRNNSSLENNAATSENISLGSSMQERNGSMVNGPDMHVNDNPSLINNAEMNESVHESHDAIQISQAPSEFAESESTVQRHQEPEPDAGLSPPTLENLSINSPSNKSKELDKISSPHCIAQEVISSSDGNKNILKEDGHSIDIPSQESLQKDNIPLCPDANQTPSETPTSLQPQLQVQEETNLHQAVPVEGQYPQNANIVGYGGHTSYVQPSQAQQWQVPVWTNTQDQQGNQIQAQYAQVYPSGSAAAWQGQNTQQQAFIYAQPQPNTQPVSHPQGQVYQHVLQSNGQYGYYQSSQGVDPQVYQYYQQQLYYMQQQQNQQIYYMQQQHLLLQQQQQQQQQQLLQQHQQLQIQQQSSALQANSSNSNFYLQDKGDELQKTEPSRPSQPSTPQKTPPNQ